ncbi:MAG: DUF2061 domain-containing protein [Candidatus Bathyarchaeota archaeon]|nr:DUF2061 domain-containing protein [Candidatus Bathyarchaeota archaeon]
MENHTRSLLKTLSWRILATSTTILLVFLLSGNTVLSVSVGSLEALVKTLIYYSHERVWNISNFGRRDHPVKSHTQTTQAKNLRQKSKKNKKENQ